MKSTEINDDTPVSSINGLATIVSLLHEDIDNTDSLAQFLCDSIGGAMKSVKFFTPQRSLIVSRKLPNILCASSKCRIRLTGKSGTFANIRFPTTVGQINKALLQLEKIEQEKGG